MIIDYDHNQNLNTDRKLDSLKESVQMALNENDAEHKGFRALFDKVNATIDSIKSQIADILNRLGQDFIVEQGTSGDWVYRKWNSGIAECWGTHKYTLTGWSAWGTLYEGSSSGGAYYQESYPTNLFKERPFSVASVKGINKGCLLETYTAGDSSQTDGYIVVRPNNTGSLGDVYINIYAMGRWK